MTAIDSEAIDGELTEERSRLRRLLPWFLVGLPVVILVVVGGAWLFGGSSLETTLETTLEELRDAGQPTSAAELNDFYIVPPGVADSTDLWVTAIDGIMAANYSERSKDLPIIGTAEGPIPPPGEAWPELEASRTLLTELAPEFQNVWKAAKAGGQARYPIDFSAITPQFSHLPSAREIARLLSLDTNVAAHDKDNTRALEDLLAIFALSDSLRGEPCLISQLVRIAIHAIGHSYVEDLLPHCQWNDAELQSLQEAIQTANFKPEFRRCLSGERATCLTTLDIIATGPFRTSNKLEALRLFEISIQGFDGTWAESIAEQRQVSAQIKTMTSSWFNKMRMRSLLMTMPVPALELATIHGARAEARQKTAVLAIAAHRHRLKHGDLPHSLEEIDSALVGTAVKALFNDPFNDQPLIYKVDESTVTIYSVGENKQDDGGNIDYDNEQPDKMDVGFKLQR